MNGARAALSLGRAIIRLLEEWGVRHVFGVPGVHNAELYRGLADAPRITHVTPRHEQGAGFMADGYARATGRPGVCFVISGPGLTNIATAMAQARGDSVPMLVISTCQPPGRRGTGNGYLHELLDQQTLGSHMTAASYTLRSPEEAPEILARAFALFQSARPGPFHIDIPTSFLAQEIDAALPRPMPLSQPPEPDPDSIGQAARWLANSRRPIILAGGGAAHAAQPLRELCERLDAPVCMTVNARGLLPPQHPLGVSHSASLPGVRALIAQSDCVLAAGTELGQTDYDMYDDGGFALPQGARLIRIDIDAAQVRRNARPDALIVADARIALQRLGRICMPRPAGDAHQRVRSARAAAEQDLPSAYRAMGRLLARLRDGVPELCMVADSTQLGYAGCLSFAAARPRSWFSAATGYGTLGYALPAAVGACLGARALGAARPVLALVGDGGLQFTLAEMASAMEAGAAPVVLLWNNGGYGEIKSYMKSRAIPPVGVDLYTPDFSFLARGFGWRYGRPQTAAELLDQARAAFAHAHPTLLEVTPSSFLESLA